MCGIAGYSGDFDTALLERMNEAIAHRGPDDAGVASYPEHRVGLAHRRLSIIDLSPRGHQPMTDITGTVSIVYNGEIYNYRALREELVADGYRFKSSCDTEVLLNLYLRDGEKMMERLNGIFAFALYDSRDGSILVVRDGVGVKPLYFTQTPKGVIFSSELKALLQESSVDRSLDHSAVHHHLLYLWSPSPLTMLKAVKKLEPGCALRIRDGRIQRQWRFYELPYDQEFIEWPVEDIVVQVRKYLTQAVERQLVADVDASGTDISEDIAAPDASLLLQS